jgi:mannose-1-phosphate guanylyltransferase
VEHFLDRTRAFTPLRLHTVYEPQLLGSAGTIWNNRHFVSGQSDFIIAYADNLTNLDLVKMIDFHSHIRSMGGILTMGLIRAPNPRACGIVTLDDGKKIIRFVEKPQKPESDLANGGIYISGCEIFDCMGEPAERTGSILDLGHHILPRLAGKMYGFPIAPCYLKDIGTPEAYKEALDQWQGPAGPEVLSVKF